MILELKFNKIFNPNSLYVLINIFISGVGFLRSFLFMKWLDNNELGIISLVQTVVLFLSLFQIGLVNGGYRIFALDKTEQQRDINNVLFSYFALLTGLVLVAWTVLVITGKQVIISNSLLLVALICGVLTLMMNWLTNTLIGKRLIGEINKISIISGLVMLALLPSICWWGMMGAVAVLFVQPIVFVVVTLVKHSDLRPVAWNFDIKLVNYILSYGFIPFLAGIFVLLNMQIERWSIAKILGTTHLGEFYLVFLYATLFVLIPTSLNNLFFPKCIKAYETGDRMLFKHLLIRYTKILIFYLSMVVLVTVVLLQPVIDWVLPLHSANTVYVFYFLPGLVLLTLCDPIGVIMNSVVKFKIMFIAGCISISVNIILICLTNYMGIFSLSAMAIIKDIVNASVFVAYLIFFLLIYKRKFKYDL